jgi:hypothetical protein
MEESVALLELVERVAHSAEEAALRQVVGEAPGSWQFGTLQSILRLFRAPVEAPQGSGSEQWLLAERTERTAGTNS